MLRIKGMHEIKFRDLDEIQKELREKDSTKEGRRAKLQMLVKWRAPHVASKHHSSFRELNTVVGEHMNKGSIKEVGKAKMRRLIKRHMAVQVDNQHPDMDFDPTNEFVSLSAEVASEHQVTDHDQTVLATHAICPFTSIQAAKKLPNMDSTLAVLVNSQSVPISASKREGINSNLANEVELENENGAESNIFNRMTSTNPCVTQIIMATGFERFLNLNGTYDILVKFLVTFEPRSNSEEVRTVDNMYLREHCPQLLIDFYEERIIRDKEDRFKIVERSSQGQEVVTINKKTMRDIYPLQLIDFYEQNLRLG